MPGMTDLILRAPVFRRLAKASRIPGAADNPLIDLIIQRLEGNSTLPQNKLVQIALDFGFYQDDAQAAHLKRDWLNQGTGPGFWPTIDTEAIIRKGMVTVLQKFQEKKRPLELFWVISGDSDTDRWEMTVSVCRRVIVVMFHTPYMPCFVPTQNSETMFVIRRESGTVVSRPVLEPKPPAALPKAKATAPKKKKKKGKKAPPKGPKKKGRR